MKLRIVLASGLILAGHSAASWGFHGHRWINHIAVFTLPAGVFGLFKAHIQTIMADAVKPDMRRYTVPDEGARHFIDVDHYEKRMPLDTISCPWHEAVALYTEDTLNRHGTGPWHVIRMQSWLTRAFADRDEERIIQLATELGHYVADLHVPLHTSSNYNGQKTGQHGIHGLWETRIPEIMLNSFDLIVDSAVYIRDLPAYIWEQVENSHLLVDSVLQMEKLATALAGEEAKFSFGLKGTQVVRHYASAFTVLYNRCLNHMVERRMREAVRSVGSMWYTAWVDAGQPVLRIPVPEHAGSRSAMTVPDTVYSTGSMIGRQE